MTVHTPRQVALVSDTTRLELKPSMYGVGFSVYHEVEGFGAGDVDNDITPHLRRRGGRLGVQREVESDMKIPVIVRSTSSDGVRELVTQLVEVLNVADGTIRVEVTNPATGETRWREVAYREGLRTPVWRSPVARRYDLLLDYLDPWAYALEPSATRIWTSPDQGDAGWVAPFIFPLVSGGLGGPELGSVTNGGDRPAPLTVTFGGQCTEPRVRNLTTGAVIGIRGSLAWDERITVDAYHETVELWRTGEPNIRESVPGRLTRDTRLTQMTIPPGRSTYELRAEAASEAFADLSTPSTYAFLE